MKTVHTEKYFEDDIYEHLTSHGWLGGDSGHYAPGQALYPEDAIAWVREAYPKQWEKFCAQNSGNPEEVFLKQLVRERSKQGTLSVLRHGFKIAGLGATRMAMSMPKPSSGNNPDAVSRYNAIRCRVVRQVHYSPQRPGESIDLVLFINGIPVATLELKTQFTQTVHDAIKQYCFDRPPKDPTTRGIEPLLQFKTGAIVHFAVSTEEVYMTTRLAGTATQFLPFNQGYNEGAGNPPNPEGYKTAHLWERVFDRDAWLHIIAKFVHLERKGNRETLIFPRFHQWDAVTKIIDDVRTRSGRGDRYLVQHSAGSGKSNSIGWLAHHLSSLWVRDDKKLFDSVIVVTDRTVLDKQLQDTIYQFDHKQGVVERITERGEAKSTQVADALAQKKPIIIVTIQTFAKVLEKLGSQEMQDHTFAVIADEAHSSQTGKAAASLKQALGFSAGGEEEDVSLEEIMTELSNSRYGAGNISYFAFTATPKPKTMQIFGTKDEAGHYQPFHSYPMRQAIEEGFILDVLKGYIPYKVAYKLAHEGKEYDDEEVDKSEASKALTRWVRLHPYNIAQKVKIIAEHFREHVAGRLDGNAKAMVVTCSRKEAVRYKIAMDAYLRESGYAFGTLVAFSGEVNDRESSDFPLTEHNMNPGVQGRDIRDVFDGEEYQLLIVANKFQTGFDQPKLVAMYVDKQLSGVATVQTLSRLNRTWPGKDWTAILDFVNDPEQVLADFQTYYRGCELQTGADPQMLIDLQTRLDAEGLYYDSEVDAFVEAYWNAGEKGLGQKQLQAKLSPVLQRFGDMVSAAKHSQSAGSSQELERLRLMVKNIESFCSLYDFLSQIIPFGDPELEKRYIFFRHLLHPLREALRTETPKDGGVDLSAIRLTHYRIHRTREDAGLNFDPEGDSVLETPTVAQGSGAARDRKQALLSQIVEQMNQIFEGDLSDADVISYAEGVRDKLMEDREVALQARNNASLDQFANGKIKQAIPTAIWEMRNAHESMTDQVMADSETMKRFAEVITRMVYEVANEETG